MFHAQKAKWNNGKLCLLVKFQFKIVRVLLLKKFDTDLLRNDLRADKVFLGKTKSHLFQDELDLFIDITQ